MTNVKVLCTSNIMFNDKILLDYTNLFSSNIYDRIRKRKIKFKLRKIDETRNYFIEEFKPNNFMSKKNEEVCMASNYIAVTGCVLISTFASLVGVSIGIPSSANGLRLCGVTVVIKKYKTIIKKK